MTINSTTNRVAITSGSTITITNLEAQSADQIKVVKLSALGVPTTLTITTHYTINSTLTTVTLLTALVTDEKAVALLNIPTTHSLSYNTNGAFNIESLSNQIDKMSLKLKELEEKVGRAIKVPVNNTETSLTIPSLVDNAGLSLVVNATEDGFEFV